METPEASANVPHGTDAPAYDSLEKAYLLIHGHLSNIQNPVIFELGMCDGYHTKMLLSMCRSQPRYFGFEPDPRNLNKITGQRLDQYITFTAAAVGNVTGTVPFHLSTPEPGGATGSSSLSEFTPVLTENWPWLKEQAQVPVACWRMDDFCALHQLDHIDFIWMDVQGAERLVFEGAQKMLPKTKLLWTEYDSGTFYKDSSALVDILKALPGWKLLANCGGDALLANHDQKL